jgi:hypothetical protein
MGSKSCAFVDLFRMIHGSLALSTLFVMYELLFVGLLFVCSMFRILVWKIQSGFRKKDIKRKESHRKGLRVMSSCIHPHPYHYTPLTLLTLLTHQTHLTHLTP